MRGFSAKLLRNHWHALLIVPLVIIAVTWPIFPRIFDSDEFWLHTNQIDNWFKFWDAWHLEKALAGQADYYFTDTLFYPRGVSLAFHQISLPHALLMLFLKIIIPADDAYKLLFLLILCFNAFSAYLLIQHLLKDKWIALFGALVVGVATPHTHYTMLPDLITLGTIPLTIYFLHRAIAENRWRLAALAGMFAGLTAFIGMYTFLINLMTIGFYSCFTWSSFWRKPAFWRALILFFAACGIFSFLRVYPMLADSTLFEERIQEKPQKIRSNDVLDFFVLTRNPFTGGFLHSLYDAPADHQFNDGYLGYINLLFLASALLFSRHRRSLTPWLTILVFFAMLRLGGYLTLNGAEYPAIALPDYFLSDWIPLLFQFVNIQEYYYIGMALPLAVLSSFGLAALLRSKRPKIRIALVLTAAFILAIEFHVPPEGETLEPEKTAFIDWLGLNSESPIQLVNLPRKRSKFYVFLQSLAGYPHIYGATYNEPLDARDYIKSNLLLRAWLESRSIHCLHYNRQEYLAALDGHSAGDSTYIAVHHWRWGDELIMPSFTNAPALYDNGFVSLFKWSDMRLNCQNQGGELPQFTHLAQSAWATPGSRASIVSFHPRERIDAEHFHYLASLFSDWKSLLHLYVADDGKLVIQNEGELYENVDAFASDNQIVYLVYDATGGTEPPIDTLTFLNQFSFCQRQAHDDGAVIELYLKPEFSCALYTSADPFQVRYENGAQLENLLYEIDQDYMDVHVLWRRFPPQKHSISFQFFDAAGGRIAGRDYVVSRNPVAHHQIDISNLPAGDYAVKIVYYNFETGESVPGTVSGDGARFDRELAFATIRKT